MRYCHNCHKTTTGDALFCHFCGSTYDAKLCPARHLNPRWAQVCSECGSRDLKPLLLALSLLPGVGLAALLVFVVIGIFRAILTNQAIQAQLIVLLLILALLWWLYLQLPHFIQNMFRSLWHKQKKERHTH